jgi:hypothetical protein
MSRRLFIEHPVQHQVFRIHAVEFSSERKTVIDANHPQFSPTRTRFSAWVVAFCVLCGSGCATLPYRYGNFRPSDAEPPAEIAIEYGQPQKTLDNIAWATGIWSRILFMNSGVNKHELSEKTREKLVAYLEENELEDVLVRVNQYDPKGEWRRLRENKRVAPGWRYTVGLVGLAQYSIIPGRIFGGDQYNPFTNSLYINSDVPAIVLHEAAYAKDVHGRPLPGTYAFLNEIPVVSLWRRTMCVNDVLGYAQTNDDWAMERETYRVVYPQMGANSTSLAGAFIPFWDGIVLTVAGAAAGHATGRIAIYQRTRDRDAMFDDNQGIDRESELEPEEPLISQSGERTSKSVIQVTNHEVESPEKE